MLQELNAEKRRKRGRKQIKQLNFEHAGGLEKQNLVIYGSVKKNPGEHIGFQLKTMAGYNLRVSTNKE